MPIQEQDHLAQTAAEILQTKAKMNAERAERAKVRAIEGVEAMSDYLAELRHRRANTDKLRAARLAREAIVTPVEPVAVPPVQAKPKVAVKAKVKRKPRKLSS